MPWPPAPLNTLLPGCRWLVSAALCLLFIALRGSDHNGRPSVEEAARIHWRITVSVGVREMQMAIAVDARAPGRAGPYA